MSVERRTFQRGMSLIELLLAVVLGLLLLAGLGLAGCWPMASPCSNRW